MDTELHNIALIVNKLSYSHPIRVGIDGATASGKTTFSKNLSKHLLKLDRHIINVSLDNFHNQKIIRYKDGRTSPEGYFNNAYNIDGILSHLLQPIAIAPNYKYKSKIHDLKTDQILDLPWENANQNSILIVEGSFSLRKKLNSFYDFKIFLDVKPQISEDRAAVRDAHLFDSPEAARIMTRNRYLEAHKIYLNEESPKKYADIIINNNEPTNPTILPN